MSPAEIETKIRSLLGNINCVRYFEQLACDQPFAEIPGWDSFCFAEFIIELQRAFSIRLSTLEIISMTDMAKAVAAVQARLSGPG